MRLDEVGLTLADIDLGGIDAESDPRLEEYFVTTPYVHNAFSGRRSLFLGRKGSGKSALFTQLPRLASTLDSPDRSVALLTPDQYSWSALKKYREQGLLDEHAHTNAWKLSLAIEISAALLEIDKAWTPGAGEALEKIRKFLTDNFGTVTPGLLNTAKSLIKGVQQFNLSAFGFGVGMSKQSPEHGLSQQSLKNFSNFVRSHLLSIILFWELIG